MTSVALTGAGGFLGWHVRAALRAVGVDADAVTVGANYAAENAARALRARDRFIHIAGVNRGSDHDVQSGNALFAEQAAEAIRRADAPPRVVVFANSIQASNGTPYGEAKARASELLRAAAASVGSEYVDVSLPNLFGEHGQPHYNSVTATFCHLLANGGQPTVENDKELVLLHAQNAADVLVGTRSTEKLEEVVERSTVSGLLNRLRSQATTYSSGEIPDIVRDFDRDLFNTYRSYTFPAQSPIGLTKHADARGAFFEIIRSHGGAGQSSFSTTVAGVTRGDHYHRRKIERFTVLSGQARISLRKLFSDEVVSFDVSGEQPQSVDMPTMWTHNIKNTGDEILYTSFWTNEMFNPNSPDTISEVV